MAKKVNKEEKELQFSLIKGDNTPILDLLHLSTKGNGKFIKYGEENDAPLKLWNTYLNNSILFGVINGTSDLVCGEGILSNYNGLNEEDETIQEVITQCIKDYLIYGGFAVEVIKTKGGDVSQFIHQDFKRIRVNEELTTAYISNQWGRWQGKDVLEVPLWTKDTKEKHYIIYCRGKLTDSIYPIPLWCGAVMSADILNRVHQFHSTSVDNNFNVSAIINFNNGKVSKAEKEIIEERLKDKFCGSNNGSTMMTTFNEDKEHSVTIEKLDSDNWADKYNSLIEYCQNDIFVSMRAVPQLFGIRTGESTAFNKEEFAEALALYEKQMILPIRDYIKKQIDKTMGIIIDFKEAEVKEEVSITEE